MARSGGDERHAEVDMVASVRDYLSYLLKLAPGMKALVYDGDPRTGEQGTLQMISSLEGTLSLAKKEVFLLEKLKPPPEGSRAESERLPLLKAVVWVRPTVENISLLKAELGDPQFSEYHIAFTNRVRRQLPEALEELAEADRFNLVKNVCECYGDYVALDRELFTLNATPTVWDRGSPRIDRLRGSRLCDGVRALLLSLKKRPLVRYSAESEAARSLAEAVQDDVDQDTMFNPDASDPEGEWATAPQRGRRRASSAPVLLVVDRADDLLTPLLNQWTYQAMIHELLGDGLQNNRVRFEPQAPTLRGERTKEFSVINSNFYQEQKFGFWGDVCKAAEERKARWRALSSDINEVVSGTRDRSMSELKEMLEHTKNKGDLGPEAQQDMNFCLTTCEEIAHVVKQQRLWDVGHLEQQLVNTLDRGNMLFHDHLRALRTLLLGAPSPDEPPEGMPLDEQLHSLQRERLLLLFALRHRGLLYEKQTERRGAGTAEAAVQRDRLIRTEPEGRQFYDLLHELGGGGGGGDEGEGTALSRLIEGVVRRMSRRGESGYSALLQAVRNGVRDHQKQQASAAAAAAAARGAGGGGAAAAAAAAAEEEEEEDLELMRHRPRLAWTLKVASEGKLPLSEYPVVEKTAGGGAPSGGGGGGGGTQPPQDLLVFVVGGLTFAEARVVHEFNALQRQLGGSCRCVVGGDFLLSTREFIDQSRDQRDVDMEVEGDDEEDSYMFSAPRLGLRGIRE